MFVNGIGTASPPRRYSKAECWKAFAGSAWFNRLDRRSHLIAETVLTRDNGIETRALAVESLDEVFAIDPDTLHRRFLIHAPKLASDAARTALDDCDLAPGEVDAVVISTCTGYLCPGLSSYVVERLGLRRDVQAFDLVGQGCAAALPNWRLAESLLAAGAARHVLSACVEVSSAAMCLDNDPGVLISACLFGDGAGAAVLSRNPAPDRRRIEWKRYGSLLNPAKRGALRFDTRGGMLRNILSREVPRLAADHAHDVLWQVLEAEGAQARDIAAWILHAGGRDVLRALEERIGLPRAALRHSARILNEFGNLSSAFVVFVLQDALRDHASGGRWWMSSFGAGFSCHGALLEVE